MIVASAFRERERLHGLNSSRVHAGRAMREGDVRVRTWRHGHYGPLDTAAEACFSFGATCSSESASSSSAAATARFRRMPGISRRTCARNDVPRRAHPVDQEGDLPPRGSARHLRARREPGRAAFAGVRPGDRADRRSEGRRKADRADLYQPNRRHAGTDRESRRHVLRDGRHQARDREYDPA